MVIVVATAFFLSWTPFYVINTVGLFHPFLRHSNFLFTLLNTHLLGFLNSCVNPFIYTIMSDRFRKGFRHILETVCCLLCSRGFGSYKRNFRHRASTVLSYVTQNSMVPEGGDGEFISEYSLNANRRVNKTSPMNNRESTTLKASKPTAARYNKLDRNGFKTTDTDNKAPLLTNNT